MLETTESMRILKTIKKKNGENDASQCGKGEVRDPRIAPGEDYAAFRNGPGWRETDERATDAADFFKGGIDDRTSGIGAGEAVAALVAHQ